MARTVQKSISSSGDSIETMEDHPVGTNANISTEDGQLNEPYNASVRSTMSVLVLLYYFNHYVFCKFWSAKILGR